MRIWGRRRETERKNNCVVGLLLLLTGPDIIAWEMEKRDPEKNWN
jgi:hypothetical protein